ncbi:MAG TPA: LysE/ArgO family amino acid transporter [Noviherbaspirillum sp.]|jgi:L-lysine exporter family protein LysE/ArgO|uniref:LysE/ArgO family amino acid transporter n=1 Tax=Noviherbaspirillum sp. TaxID=1926288 RepID=UPI002F93CB28
MLSSYLKGLGLGAGLILAIGSQNAHVLRMGLLRRRVGLVVAVCMLCEAMLIAGGVAGVGGAVQANPTLLAAARWGGALFLAAYGLRAWRNAFRSGALHPREHAGDDGSLRGALAATLAVTLLNPHVYLDTVVLLGAVGGQQGDQGKWWFALGAMCAAFAWFPLLGYGARLLAPWFARPAAWRMLDGCIGLVMLALAAGLVADARAAG